MEITEHLSGARNGRKEKGARNNNITAKSPTMVQVWAKRDACMAYKYLLFKLRVAPAVIYTVLLVSISRD